MFLSAGGNAVAETITVNPSVDMTLYNWTALAATNIPPATINAVINSANPTQFYIGNLHNGGNACGSILFDVCAKQGVYTSGDLSLVSTYFKSLHGLS